MPLGWKDLKIDIQGGIVNLPAAVLSPKAQAYGIVLGLDYIFLSTMQINVADGVYSFKSNPSVVYPFQPGSAHIPEMVHHQQRQNQVGKGPKPKKLSSVALITYIPTPALCLEPVRRDVTDYIYLTVTNAHLMDKDKQRLKELLESYPEVCTHKPGRTEVLQHQIHTTSPVPIKQRPYRMSPTKQIIVKEQLQEMLTAGIVEPSHSGWASPVVLPPKKDGGHRFCVDFRKVNAITETDAYPLPYINKILKSLSGAAIFSIIDLNSGYWKVPME